jgi:phosphatidylserine decarboxylase
MPLLVVAVALLFVGHGLAAAASIVLLGLAGFVFWFFRNPERTGPPDPLAVWSPADGKVVAAGIVPHQDMPGGQALRIGIFLSLINVHVSWSPISGRIVNTTYFPGKYLNAMNDKSATENERKVLDMEGDLGHRVVVALVAGLVARRIICPLETGDRVEQGEKIALIRFGSRAELYLPADSVLQVHLGQRVRACETVLARLPDKAKL